MIGALAGILGSMMALEAIREIVGLRRGLGRSALSWSTPARCGFETLRYARDPANPLNGDVADDYGSISAYV